MPHVVELRELLLSDVTVWTVRDESGVHRDRFFQALANHEFAQRVLHRSLPQSFSRFICGTGHIHEGLVQARFLDRQRTSVSVTGEGLGLLRLNRIKPDMVETYVRTVAARFDVQASSETYHFPRTEFARVQPLDRVVRERNGGDPRHGHKQDAINFAVPISYKKEGTMRCDIIRFTDYADFLASIRALLVMTGAQLSTRLVEAALLEHASAKAWKKPLSAIVARLHLEKAGLLKSVRPFAAKSRLWTLSELCEQFLVERPTLPSLQVETLRCLCERFKQDSGPLPLPTKDKKSASMLRGEHLFSSRASRKKSAVRS
ncbi:hypothetical protein HZA87_06100 [Candidatus Uhrbacteria bacterium]|nr:hypothetical protein [Candidatus Uhrbacteria bacterium]